MSAILTRKELERRLAPSFTPDQTTVLADAVLHLADAQARTDVQLKALTEAQARTEAKVELLAEAQARTEARMEQGFAYVWGAISELTTQMTKLGHAVSSLGQHVGSMVNTFGFNLEKYTGALLPSYLEQHSGIAGLTPERSYFADPGGRDG